MRADRSLIFAARRRRWRLLWLATLALVIVGSLLPATSAPISLLDRAGINDKLLHLAAYAVLGFLPTLYEGRRGTLLSAATALAVGILLEYGQLYSAGRSFDVFDMAADAAGVLLGLAAGWLLHLLL